MDDFLDDALARVDDAAVRWLDARAMGYLTDLYEEELRESLEALSRERRWRTCVKSRSQSQTRD